MKRIICLITVLCLVLGSFSFCFATPTSWDTADQANLRYIYQTLTSGGNLYNLINNIKTNTQTISNTLTDIKGYLFSDNNSIAYWVHAIDTWMSPIYDSLVNLPIDLTKIAEGLWFPLANGSSQSYLSTLRQSLTNQYYGGSYSSDYAPFNAHNSLFSNYSTGQYLVRTLDGAGNFVANQFRWQSGTPLGNLALLLQAVADSNAIGFNYLLSGMSVTQTAINPITLQSETFTPFSVTNGIYTWLSKIQNPTARLAYVLASDERIAAQEAAASNEEAVVDNFIDSTGNGSASPSDIGSISDLSSGYKSNFGSDASVSDIFNIFNSNNMGWFSQETANQLDTSTHTRRGSSFDTPLLDQQIDDIYDQIGVKHD